MKDNNQDNPWGGYKTKTERRAYDNGTEVALSMMALQKLYGLKETTAEQAFIDGFDAGVKSFKSAYAKNQEAALCSVAMLLETIKERKK